MDALEEPFGGRHGRPPARSGVRTAPPVDPDIVQLDPGQSVPQ